MVGGGGLAGVCCAVTAARAGLRVTLAQDRPVLGGNASSEVRLWVLGATSHMGNNNRWAHEGGVVDEVLVENTYRNPEGNALLFDALLLNTAVSDVTKRGEAVASVTAFCSQNSTRYELTAPLFCDASGDGIGGFLAAATSRMGAERREEFGEGFAPDAGYGELLGHSLYFYSRDTGRPVRFVPPGVCPQGLRLPRRHCARRPVRLRLPDGQPRPGRPHQRPPRDRRGGRGPAVQPGRGQVLPAGTAAGHRRGRLRPGQRDQRRRPPDPPAQRLGGRPGRGDGQAHAGMGPSADDRPR